MSKVSVIVPIFNAEKNLDKCIKSILNQTLKEFELILVNDGSTDNSLKICEKYQKEDRRIVLIDKKNEGSIPTRRRGIEISKSSYIMFVDADDWINKKTIEILYNESIEDKSDITVCNTTKVLGKGILFKKKNINKYFRENKIYNKEEIKNELVIAYFYGHPFPSSLCAKLYKKDLLVSSGKFLERIRFMGDDLFYNIEVFLKAEKVKVIVKDLYYYRLGGFTSKYMPYLFDDVVNGYNIQKDVINEHYLDSKQKQYNGISIMLLNTFKYCIFNLFKGNLNKSEIMELIQEYTANESIIESLSNNGSIKYFPFEYLNAIRNKNIKYLYELGLDMYKRHKPKMFIINLISKIPIF